MPSREEMFAEFLRTRLPDCVIDFHSSDSDAVSRGSGQENAPPYLRYFLRGDRVDNPSHFDVTVSALTALPFAELWLAVEPELGVGGPGHPRIEQVGDG